MQEVGRLFDGDLTSAFQEVRRSAYAQYERLLTTPPVVAVIEPGDELPEDFTPEDLYASVRKYASKEDLVLIDAQAVLRDLRERSFTASQTSCTHALNVSAVVAHTRTRFSQVREDEIVARRLRVVGVDRNTQVAADRIDSAAVAGILPHIESVLALRDETRGVSGREWLRAHGLDHGN